MVPQIFAVAIAAAAAHPHLFFTADAVPGLRSVATTTHKPIADHFLALASAHLSDATPTTSDYGDPRFLGNQVAVWAFAYQLTGDVRYAAKAKSELLTYLGWSDWTFGESTGEDLNAAHMLLGVSCAYDWLFGYLTASERTEIATRLGAEAQKLYAAMPAAWWTGEFVQNHLWIDTAGLGLAGLALAGEDARAATWVAAAKTQLQDLQPVLGPIADGSFHEGGPYEVYGLSMALPFWTALANTGTDLTDLGVLRGFGAFRLGSMIPDAPHAMMLPYGDFTGWPTQGTVEVLRYSAARFGDATAEAAAQRWLTAGRTSFFPELWYEVFEYLYYAPAVAPLPKAEWPLDASFPDLQASVLRSSWNSGDLNLGFKAGPYGGRANFDRLKVGGAPGGWLSWGHDHNDDMSFWIYGAGEWLAPEAMGYDAGKNTGVANPANQTAYHNNMLVDGQGELGDARASDSNWNNPWFFTRDAIPLLQATGTADYAVTGARGAGLFDAALGVTRWDRMLVLARHRYVLVRDDVAAQAAHAFDWICHFSQGSSVDTASGWIEGLGNGGQALGVRVVAPAQWTATTGSQTASQMSKFDGSASTPWVRVRPAKAAAATQFLTALVPMAQAQWAGRMQIGALAAGDEGAGAVVAPGSLLEERWIFNRPSADSKAAGDLLLTAALAGMAGRSHGAPVRALLVGPGALSDQNGARQLLATQSARSIEVDLQADTLVVSGDGIADFTAFAPAALRATLNGIAVPVTLESGMVSFPASGGGASAPPGADAGSPGAADAGSPGSVGSADAGRPGSGVDGGGGSVDAGSGGRAADAGTVVGSGPADAGSTDGGSSHSSPSPTDKPTEVQASSLGSGCSSSGGEPLWLALPLLASFILRRRRLAVSR